jgi:hypothetical protein
LSTARTRENLALRAQSAARSASDHARRESTRAGSGRDGPFAAIGLRDGDLLLEVNGRSIATPDAAMAAFAALRTASHVWLAIVRAGPAGQDRIRRPLLTLPARSAPGLIRGGSRFRWMAINMYN